MNFGLDLLGIAKFSKTAIEAFPEGFALGCFANTFGDALPVVDKLLKTGKCPAVRVHLMWKDSHNYSRKDFPSIYKEAKRWKPLTIKYPRILFYFSGACEHNLNHKDATELANGLANIFPEATYIVNTPLIGHGSDIIIVIDKLNEKHGAGVQHAPLDCLFSYDGNSCTDSDVQKMKDDIGPQIFFFWDSRFNGKWEDKDTTPRPMRKGWPDKALIESVAALSCDQGGVSLPHNWIYKSHAENTGTGDLRAEHPVFIIPLKVKEITLRDKGKTKATFPYYGPYAGGGHRYYGTKWGYQIANKPLEVWAEKRKYGAINPTFRAN